VFIASVKL